MTRTSGCLKEILAVNPNLRMYSFAEYMQDKGMWDAMTPEQRGPDVSYLHSLQSTLGSLRTSLWARDVMPAPDAPPRPTPTALPARTSGKCAYCGGWRGSAASCPNCGGPS